VAADLTVEPFKRLAALAPQGTGAPDLQAAADRYANTQDLYSAAADLWEEAAVAIDTAPPPSQIVNGQAPVSSVSQDGITVTYSRGVIDYAQDQRLKQVGAYRRVAADFRRKSKPSTPLVIGADAIDRFEQDPYDFDPENGIIEVSNWGQ
jgi:hypothetical protein